MTTPPPEKPFHRLLLTGAAGRLGSMLRPRIKPWAEVLRLSDEVSKLDALGCAADGEEVMLCDLADNAAMLKLLEGVDAVLHFGGISFETRFEPIMQANILGLHDLYEAVHKAGARRVIFASSSHVTGYYPVTETVDRAAISSPWDRSIDAPSDTPSDAPSGASRRCGPCGLGACD